MSFLEPEIPMPDQPAESAAELQPGELMVWEAPSFEDLARARWLLLQNGREGEASYRALLDRFEVSQGQIIHAAWTTAVAGGAVVVNRPHTRLSRLLLLPARADLYAFTDFVGAGDTWILLQLARVENIATMCRENLRGSSLRIPLANLHVVLRQLFAIADARAELGGRAEAEDESDHQFDDDARGEKEIRRRVRYDLDRSEMLYRHLADNSAQVFYFWGMMLGALLVAIAGTLAAVFLPGFVHAVWGISINHTDVAVSAGALAAGALGAVISVMWRMTSGAFKDVSGFGPENLRRLGTFRPFIGAVFGLIFYFALKAGLVSASYVPSDAGVYFYLFTGFLAGFSERLVPGFLGDKEQTAQGQGDQAVPTDSA